MVAAGRRSVTTRRLRRSQQCRRPAAPSHPLRTAARNATERARRSSRPFSPRLMGRPPPPTAARRHDGVRPDPPPHALRSPACTAGRRPREGLSPNAAVVAERPRHRIPVRPQHQRHATARHREGWQRALIRNVRNSSPGTRDRPRPQPGLHDYVFDLSCRCHFRFHYWPTALAHCSIVSATARGTTALGKDGKRWWEEWFTRRKGPHVIVQSVRAMCVGADGTRGCAEASVCGQDLPDAGGSSAL